MSLPALRCGHSLLDSSRAHLSTSRLEVLSAFLIRPPRTIPLGSKDPLSLQNGARPVVPPWAVHHLPAPLLTPSAHLSLGPFAPPMPRSAYLQFPSLFLECSLPCACWKTPVIIHNPLQMSAGLGCHLPDASPARPG